MTLPHIFLIRGKLVDSLFGRLASWLPTHTSVHVTSPSLLLPSIRFPSLRTRSNPIFLTKPVLTAHICKCVPSPLNSFHVPSWAMRLHCLLTALSSCWPVVRSTLFDKVCAYFVYQITHWSWWAQIISSPAPAISNIALNVAGTSYVPVFVPSSSNIPLLPQLTLTLFLTLSTIQNLKKKKIFFEFTLHHSSRFGFLPPDFVSDVT